MGDQLPSEDITVLPYRHLNAIHEEYIDDMENIGEKIASDSHFNECFNELTNTLKIRLCRDTGSFVTCTVCDAYHTRLRSAKTMSERRVLKNLRRNHLDKQRIQREKNYKHKLKAMMQPDRYLSIIIDGMDQKKTDCPVVGKSVKEESPLKQRIIGVKVHGIGNYVYVLDESVPGGSNIIIEILRRVLLDLDEKKLLPTHMRSTLYLQVDNCGENKNKSMFAFLTDLVRRSVFWKIKAGFLMVGHTHEDIDQFFSVISRHLKKLHIICPDPPSLVQAIRDAFSSAQLQDSKMFLNILTFPATSMTNYSLWYEQFIDSSISYHQEPHQFRIKTFNLPANDTCTKTIVLLHYKMWSESKYWLPMQHSVENDDVVHTHTDQDPPVKKRTMSRFQITKGQRSAHLKTLIQQKALAADFLVQCDNNDIPENQRFHDNAESGVLENSASFETQLELTTHHNLKGILWISDSPSLESARLCMFDAESIQKNLQKAHSVLETIQTKFCTSYRNIFSDAVMANWSAWLNEQIQIWDSNVLAQRKDCAPLQFPRSLSERTTIQEDTYLESSEAEAVEDCAFADLDDDQETLTHSNFTQSELGSFSKRQRLEMIRLSLADVETWQKNVIVHENMACIYSFKHEDRESKTEKSQIAVGLVKKEHVCSETGMLLYDIRFCPPKGARPASRNRPDTLYKDIAADLAFNTHYQSKAGKKVEKTTIYHALSCSHPTRAQ